MAEEHLNTGSGENKPSSAPPTDEAITLESMDSEPAPNPQSMKASAISADDCVKSKWVNSQNQITNWVEFANEQGWISQAPPQFGFGPKAKKYLPDVFLDDLGNHPTATAFYTDDRPLKRDGSPEHAVLIDKVGSGHCFVRNIRIEGIQVFVISPLWPYAEVPFPLNYFQCIERVFLISFR